MGQLVRDRQLRHDAAPWKRLGLESAKGPNDSKGRSLRQFDLEHRMMRYPCSYMIYSPAFEALPGDAKKAIYERLRQILTGAEKDSKYARLSAADRKAVLEILRDTKKDF